MFNRIIILLLLLLLAFDFRGEAEGGGMFQYALVLVSLFLTIAGFVFLAGSLKELQGTRKILAYSLLCLIPISLVVAFKNQVPIDRYIRVFYPAYLLISGFVLSSLLVKTKMDVLFLEKSLVAASIVSMIWKFCYAVLVSGISLSEMRYQLLSHGTCFIFAYSFYRVVCVDQLKGLWSMVLVLVIGLFMISLTRTHLIAGMGLCVLTVYILLEIGGGRYIFKSVMSIAFVALIMLIVGVPLVLKFRPEVIDNWEQRISQATDGGMDPTGAIRIGQIRGMLLDQKEHPEDILFGRGFGKEAYEDYNYIAEKLAGSSTMGADSRYFNQESWQWPDSTHVPLLFCGGIFFFLCVVSMQAQPIFKINHILKQHPYALWVVFSSINIGFLSLFGNVVLDRYGAFLLGMISGISFAICASGDPRFQTKLRQASRGV
jgi:hypothetical protein